MKVIDPVPGRSGWEFGEWVRQENGPGFVISIYHARGRAGLRVSGRTRDEVISAAHTAIDALYEERMQQYWPQIAEDDGTTGNVSPIR